MFRQIPNYFVKRMVIGNTIISLGIVNYARPIGNLIFQFFILNDI
jgi:hypothetical protein